MHFEARRQAHVVQIFMYTALSIGANSFNDLNKPAEERWSFQTIWYSAAPTVTITSRLLKRYFNACLEYIFSFKIFMKGREIKILGSSSVLMMLFSLWQSEVISFNYTFYTQLVLFFSFFWQSWKLRLSPFTSTSPEESEVSASSLLSTFSFSSSFLKCHQSQGLRERINLQSILLLW